MWEAAKEMPLDAHWSGKFFCGCRWKMLHQMPVPMEKDKYVSSIL